MPSAAFSKAARSAAFNLNDKGAGRLFFRTRGAVSAAAPKSLDILQGFDAALMSSVPACLQNVLAPLMRHRSRCHQSRIPQPGSFRSDQQHQDQRTKDQTNSPGAPKPLAREIVLGYSPPLHQFVSLFLGLSLFLRAKRCHHWYMKAVHDETDSAQPYIAERRIPYPNEHSLGHRRKGTRNTNAIPISQLLNRPCSTMMRSLKNNNCSHNESCATVLFQSARG